MGHLVTLALSVVLSCSAAPYWDVSVGGSDGAHNSGAACFAPGADERYVWGMSREFFGDPSRFEQTNRWNATATDGGGLVQGQPTTITYSFVPDGTRLQNFDAQSQLHAWMNELYGDPEVWHALFRDVFDQWEDVAGVTFVHEPNDDGRPFLSIGNRGVLGVRGDIRIGAIMADGEGGVLAAAGFPPNGDMAFDIEESFFEDMAGDSLGFRNVLAHEIGHAIGMLHVCPSNETKLMEPFVSLAYDGPQHDDILNGQRHYGDPFERQGEIRFLGAPNASGLSVHGVSIDSQTDTDWYAIDVAAPSRVDVELVPEGTQYEAGEQTEACDSGPMLDTSALNDLSLALLESPEASEIAEAGGAGPGEGEVLSSQTPRAGRYYVRVAGIEGGDVQAYRISISAEPLDGACGVADLASPVGQLDFSDVIVFLGEFMNARVGADLAAPMGAWDINDVLAFLGAFQAGCP